MHDSNISRRSVFKLIAAASAAGAVLPHQAAAKPSNQQLWDYQKIFIDPDFLNPVIPWEMPLAESELATLAVLVDLILPADDQSPAPSSIGVQQFINEWIGAPYPGNRDDGLTIRGGVAWLNNFTWQLHRKPFTELSVTQQTSILDSICDPENTNPETLTGTRFFTKLRMLTLNGYYTHPATWKSLGYIGNVAIAGPYPGVPLEIVKLLGLDQVD